MNDGLTILGANLGFHFYKKNWDLSFAPGLAIINIDAANPKVELNYLDEDHDQVRITGVAEVLTDGAVLHEIWEHNALLRRYLGSPDNPELIIYRIRPSRIRFMREWALEYHEVPLPG